MSCHRLDCPPCRADVQKQLEDEARLTELREVASKAHERVCILRNAVEKNLGVVGAEVGLQIALDERRSALADVDAQLRRMGRIA